MEVNGAHQLFKAVVIIIYYDFTVLVILVTVLFSIVESLWYHLISHVQFTGVCGNH